MIGFNWPTDEEPFERVYFKSLHSKKRTTFFWTFPSLVGLNRWPFSRIEWFIRELIFISIIFLFIHALGKRNFASFHALIIHWRQQTFPTKQKIQHENKLRIKLPSKTEAHGKVISPGVVKVSSPNENTRARGGKMFNNRNSIVCKDSHPRKLAYRVPYTANEFQTKINATREFYPPI